MLTNSSLDQVQSLIRANDYAGARNILGDILKIDPQNADAWYLVAYITEDKAKRIQALQKTLAINPAHEKAAKALVSLQDNDPLNDFLTSPTASGTPGGQPNVVIHMHNNVAGNTMSVGGGLLTQYNDTAFWVGFFISLFTGIYGISYLITGRLGKAVGHFLLFSVLWPIIASILIAITLGFGVLLVIPLHVWFAWKQNKLGATIS